MFGIKSNVRVDWPLVALGPLNATIFSNRRQQWDRKKPSQPLRVVVKTDTSFGSLSPSQGTRSANRGRWLVKWEITASSKSHWALSLGASSSSLLLLSETLANCLAFRSMSWVRFLLGRCPLQSEKPTDPHHVGRHWLRVQISHMWVVSQCLKATVFKLNDSLLI